MKLLHCRQCGDLVRLYAHGRHCHCGHSYGRYLDDARVVLWGPCRALGLDTGDVTRGASGTWHVSDRVVRLDRWEGP